jgi:hypothetical protein
VLEIHRDRRRLRMVTMRASVLLSLAGLGAMLAGYTSTAIVDGKPAGNGGNRVSGT